MYFKLCKHLENNSFLRFCFSKMWCCCWCVTVSVKLTIIVGEILHLVTYYKSGNFRATFILAHYIPHKVDGSQNVSPAKITTFTVLLQPLLMLYSCFRLIEEFSFEKASIIRIFKKIHWGIVSSIQSPQSIDRTDHF